MDKMFQLTAEFSLLCRMYRFCLNPEAKEQLNPSSQAQQVVLPQLQAQARLSSAQLV